MSFCLPWHPPIFRFVRSAFKKKAGKGVLDLYLEHSAPNLAVIPILKNLSDIPIVLLSCRIDYVARPDRETDGQRIELGENAIGPGGVLRLPAPDFLPTEVGADNLVGRFSQVTVSCTFRDQVRRKRSFRKSCNLLLDDGPTPRCLSIRDRRDLDVVLDCPRRSTSPSTLTQREVEEKPDLVVATLRSWQDQVKNWESYGDADSEAQMVLRILERPAHELPRWSRRSAPYIDHCSFATAMLSTIKREQGHSQALAVVVAEVGLKLARSNNLSPHRQMEFAQLHQTALAAAKDSGDLGASLQRYREMSREHVGADNLLTIEFDVRKLNYLQSVGGHRAGSEFEYGTRAQSSGRQLAGTRRCDGYSSGPHAGRRTDQRDLTS